MTVSSSTAMITAVGNDLIFARFPNDDCTRIEGRRRFSVNGQQVGFITDSGDEKNSLGIKYHITYLHHAPKLSISQSISISALKTTVLVVGGAGFIGSYVNKYLADSGYETIVLDNLSRGKREAVCRGLFVKGDLNNREDLESLFSQHKIDAVMHFAALIDVGESVKEPLRYYENNVCGTITLLDVMRKHKVTQFVFSSSAAVYGSPEVGNPTEEYPCQPINPYGETKHVVEKILPTLKKLHWCALRYFNAAGGDPSGEIRLDRPDASNLIPRILQNLDGETTIFGTDYPTKDGTCVRDYVHIHDLATAHAAALKRLLEGGSSGIYNLGNGEGHSVREVLTTVERVTGKKLHTVEGPRRPGDPPLLVADASKAKRELGWTPKYPDLDSIVKHAWAKLPTGDS